MSQATDNSRILNQQEIEAVIARNPQLTLLEPEFALQGLRIKSVVRGVITGAPESTNFTEKSLQAVCDDLNLDTNALIALSEKLSVEQAADRASLDKHLNDNQLDAAFVELAERLAKRQPRLDAIKNSL